jgi:hypothetical protein
MSVVETSPLTGRAGSDRRGRAIAMQGRRLLDDALPRLAEAVEARVNGGVATGPNAYDDIVSVVDTQDVHEIILETPPTHVSDWLHIALAHRIGHLGVPLTVVAAGV